VGGTAFADEVLWRLAAADEPMAVIDGLVFYRTRTESRWLDVKTGRPARSDQPWQTWDAGKQLVHEQALGRGSRFRIYATDGERMLWEVIQEPPRVGPMVAPGRVLFDDRDRAFALDSATGAEVWHVAAPKGSHFYGLPIVADDVVRLEYEQ